MGLYVRLFPLESSQTLDKLFLRLGFGTEDTLLEVDSFVMKS